MLTSGRSIDSSISPPLPSGTHTSTTVIDVFMVHLPIEKEPLPAPVDLVNCSHFLACLLLDVFDEVK